MNSSIPTSSANGEGAPGQKSEYDYIVLGGGTAGLAIASRLSEHREISILVLEAGEDLSNDPAVLTPALFPTTYGDPKYDWNYKTVPQKHANNKQIFYARGKQLGGSSAMNFMFWTHPSRKDIDNWGSLGNPGWSWEEFFPYFKKSETFTPPSEELTKMLDADYVDPTLHGTDGPITTMMPDLLHPCFTAWPKTVARLGLTVDGDPKGGLALGGYTVVVNTHPETKTRSYAANTYYKSGTVYPNLDVITGALVDKLILEENEGGVTARGVEWIKFGQRYTSFAKAEVILSAGVFSSPAILERSGIGNGKLLERLGIRTIVDNPGVGENMQDHALLPLGFRAKPGVPTAEDFNDPKNVELAMKEYADTRGGPLSCIGGISALFPLSEISTVSKTTVDIPSLEDPSTWHNTPATTTSSTTTPSSSITLPPIPNPSGLSQQTALILADLPTEAVAQEVLVTSAWCPEYPTDPKKYFHTTHKGNFITMLGIIEHPLSRGNVHISSRDPSVYPTIDPNFLAHDLDLEILSKIALHLQAIVRHPPLCDLLEGQGTVLQSGYEPLTEENAREFVKRVVHTENHEMGTCAMMPRELGGVVDHRFRVWGVKGLRVIDVSVVPLMPRGNPQSVVYALAERGAEFIWEDRGKREESRR